jgi:hypothetical protein
MLGTGSRMAAPRPAAVHQAAFYTLSLAARSLPTRVVQECMRVHNPSTPRCLAAYSKSIWHAGSPRSTTRRPSGLFQIQVGHARSAAYTQRQGAQQRCTSSGATRAFQSAPWAHGAWGPGARAGGRPRRARRRPPRMPTPAAARAAASPAAAGCPAGRWPAPARITLCHHYASSDLLPLLCAACNCRVPDWHAAGRLGATWRTVAGRRRAGISRPCERGALRPPLGRTRN